MPDTKHYHFIGIGGAGMSAIAQILHARGDSVSGSDRQENDATRRLRAAGVKVSIGHDAANVNGADVVVYTAAASTDNPELVAARSRKLPVLERPEMLGRLMEPYQHRIAVSGTHGKTTTTSMLGAIFQRAGTEPTVIVGGDVPALGGNARLGDGSVVIAEACEAFSSFLHLPSSLAVVLNIEADHLEHYGSLQSIEDAFRQFVGLVDADGAVVACWDEECVRRVVDGCGRRVISYGLSADAEVRAVDVDVSSARPAYTLVAGQNALGRAELRVPGEHNVVNSVGAAAAALQLGVNFSDIAAGLAAFTGVTRRFDILYDDGAVMVVDDYAHHPTEVRATIAGARSAYPAARIVAVFQPHLYSRTRIFTEEFARALALADEVVLAPIYGSREQPMDGVSAADIVDCLNATCCERARYADAKDIIAGELADQLRCGDLVLVMGAGDIRTTAEELAALLSERGGR